MNRCFSWHSRDYAQLSATPDRFQALVDAVTVMIQTQPSYTAQDLAKINVPVLIVQSEYDEFIKPEHAQYLAQSIPRADFMVLNGVSHFAPLQRPDKFNIAILEFFGKILPR